ncbi:CBM_HP2_G0027010.mRNA.1.CDS.1 [Saccharomyces cerevisiae]|nr:CBM_HP2_G0027010.mRNA.1.CDS.1 [Saccharomyces cerevisiae]CAI6637481.1 CBM_HP2_G0027010.mRNA.1.CDS.1 [Saccharomyces cerevisiae]
MSVPLYGSFRQIHDFMQRGAKLYKNENNYIQKNFAEDKPVIIMHGQDDTINDPKGSEKFIQDCPSADKELKLYPGARHSIFSLETDKVFNTVFNDMKQWLDKHTTTEAKP